MSAEFTSVDDYTLHDYAKSYGINYLNKIKLVTLVRNTRGYNWQQSPHSISRRVHDLDLNFSLQSGPYASYKSISADSPQVAEGGQP